MIDLYYRIILIEGNSNAHHVLEDAWWDADSWFHKAGSELRHATMLEF